MKNGKLILLLLLTGILLGSAAGVLGLTEYSQYELLFILIGVPIILLAYHCYMKWEPQIEISMAYDAADSAEEEVLVLRQKQRRDYKALIKDIFNKSKSSGIEKLTGEPKFAIFFISLVMLIPFLASQVNLFVDTMWLSYLGAEAVSAVGIIKPFTVLIVCIANGIGIGGSNRISFYLGRGNKDSAEKVVTNTLMFGLVASAVSTAVLLVSMSPMLDLIGAGDVKDLAMDYFLPLNICIVITITSSVIANIMRAEGAVGKVTLAMTLGVIVNIALDPLLIFVADMGISGAAWATNIANLSTLVIAYHWYAKGSMHLDLKFFGRPSRQYLSEINSVATPRALEECYSAAQLMVQRVMLIAAGGYIFVTIQDVGFTYMYLLQTIPSAVGAALMTVCSVAAGQGDFDKMRTALIVSYNGMMAVALTLSFLLFIFAEPLMGLFIHGDTTEYTDIIVWTARLYAMIIPIYAVSRLCSPVMQVLKKSLLSARINLISVSIRIVLLFVPPLIGDTSYYAYAIAIAAGYIAELILKVGATGYSYSHMDFKGKVAA